MRRALHILALALAVVPACAAYAAETGYFRLTRPISTVGQDGAPTADQLFAAPFSAGSAWRSAVPAGARMVDVPGIGGYFVGLSEGPSGYGVSIPITRATQADGTYRVLYNLHAWDNLASGRWKPVGNAADVEAEILASSSPRFPFAYHTYASQSATSLVLPATFVPVKRMPDGTAPPMFAPDGIAPSGNADSHMVVFQPDGTAYETYATIVLSNRTVVCLTYQVTDPASAGDGVQNGVTASLLPVYAGVIRKAEAQSLRIDHAIKIMVPASMLTPEFTYPALAFDRGALRESPPYSGTVPMGGRLAIPSGVDLGTLGLRSDAGRAIAAAGQKYGFIVTDRGGGGITVVTEAGAQFTGASGLEGDLRKIFAASRRVLVP